MVFKFLENAMNLGIFTHASVPHSKFQAEFFENMFPPTAERGRENWDLLYQNSIRRYEGELGYLYFLWFVIFLNVMTLQPCK